MSTPLELLHLVDHTELLWRKTCVLKALPRKGNSAPSVPLWFWVNNPLVVNLWAFLPGMDFSLAGMVGTWDRYYKIKIHEQRSLRTILKSFPDSVFLGTHPSPRLGKVKEDIICSPIGPIIVCGLTIRPWDKRLFASVKLRENLLSVVLYWNRFES